MQNIYEEKNHMHKLWNKPSEIITTKSLNKVNKKLVTLFIQDGVNDRKKNITMPLFS